MYIKMLEAVSEMLSSSSPVTPGTAPAGATTHKAPSNEKVECAKLMLDKIIEGMQDSNKIIRPKGLEYIDEPILAAEPSAPKPELKKNQPSLEYDHERKIFTKVGNVPADGMVEVNGRRIEATKLIGKSIQDASKMGVKI